MLETTVYDGPEELWLQEEVPEAGAVDGNVRPLHLLLPRGSRALRGSLWLIILLIIEQLVVNVILSHYTRLCFCLVHTQTNKTLLMEVFIMKYVV